MEEQLTGTDTIVNDAVLEQESTGSSDPVLSSIDVPSAPVAVPPAAPSGPVRIRAKQCSVRGCTGNSLRNPELLFVGVPTHGYPERRFVWLTLMQSFRDTKRSYCCSRHFTVPDDFKDFDEFISAPPGYKRQLMVKKGVVPHLNMPPPNLAALPPLTNRWPMTLPDSMLKRAGPQDMPLVNMHHPMVTPQASRSYVPRSSKSVQTDPPLIATRPRKVQPSLQYCRLCFKRQDLEPIFTGDKTLIEPDLVEKIYICTEIKITVENDFPSSICTLCYNNVEEFTKFRQLVQKNDQSLRVTLGSEITMLPMLTTASTIQSSSVRTKVTLTIPKQTMAIPRTTSHTMGIKGPGIYPNPAFRRTSLFPTPIARSLPSSTSTIQSRNEVPDLLEVRRIEDLRTYERRQLTIERNQPVRNQRMQDSLYPIPYRKLPTEVGKTSQNNPLTRVTQTVNSTSPADVDPFENAELQASSDSEARDIFVGDRIVPVTLIRVQQHQNTEQPEVKEEETTPLEMPIEAEKPTVEETNVLHAVKLVPSSVAQEVSKRRNSVTGPCRFSRSLTASSRSIEEPRGPTWIRKEKKKEGPKKPYYMPGNLVPKLSRAIKFPGTLTTLFSGNSKKAIESVQKTNISEQIKPLGSCPLPPESPESSIYDKPSTPPSQFKNKSIGTLAKPTVDQTQSVEIEKGSSKIAQPNESKSTETKLAVSSITSKQLPFKVQLSKSQLKLLSPKVLLKPVEPKLLSPKVLLKPVEPKLIPKVVIPKEVSSKILEGVKLRIEPVTTPKSDSQKENDVPSSPIALRKADSAPTVTNALSSPRSTRLRKIPAKYQGTDAFPMPKIITIKQEPGSPSTEQTNVKLSRHETTLDKCEPKAKKHRKSLPPEIAIPKSVSTTHLVENPAATRLLRRSLPVSAPSLDKTAKTNSLKKPTVLEDPKSTKIQPKLYASKAETPPKNKNLLSTDKSGSTRIEPLKKGVQLRTSPKSAVAVMVTDIKKKETSTSKTHPIKKTQPGRPVSATRTRAQSWKCPFCPTKVYDAKNGLVKHLGRRHGMDYATVRQRLAIYGGNW
ncbi:uncharacterized protein LOC129738447 [Uranotaenia lowii]|uniref:uncharacterized protein LOC129738447 n=1 Tax=Uranotaenia lowii TaxID=190385 RepID=UPI002478D972|nr:uncharacterized protein LOC129738447 [Uranotaenia lowii]